MMAKDDNFMYPLADQMRANYDAAREWAMPILDARKGLNLASFRPESAPAATLPIGAATSSTTARAPQIAIHLIWRDYG